MNIEIANRLVELRKKENISQEELASRLGLSRQAVSKWERAEASPDTDNLILLARIYNISLDELLKTDGEIPLPKSENDKKESVHISWKGIHVEDSDSSVHIGLNGIYIHDKDDSILDCRHENSKTTDAVAGIFSLISLLIYLYIGSVYSAWHPTWIIFLFIPVIASLVTAIIERNPNNFAYPVLIVAAYLILGFYYGLWHPGWIVFLTIPVYYMIIGFFKKK